MLYLKLARYVPAIMDIFAEIIRSTSKESDSGKKVTRDELDKIKLVAAAKVDLVIHDIIEGEL